MSKYADLVNFISISHIKQYVAQRFDMSVDDLVSKQQGNTLMHVRDVALYFCAELTSHSNEMIGKSFGRKTGGIVSDAIKDVRAAIAEDKNFAKLIEDVRQELTKDITVAPIPKPESTKKPYGRKRVHMVGEKLRETENAIIFKPKNSDDETPIPKDRCRVVSDGLDIEWWLIESDDVLRPAYNSGVK
jgi:hypothetical protein